MSDAIFSSEFGALILAAGKGTRMCSKKPKGVHTILGEPLLGHVAGAVQPLFGSRLWAVIGHGADTVRHTFATYPEPLKFIEQKEQLGTGHALMVALSTVREAGIQHLLVVNGDTPLISTATLESFVREGMNTDFALATLTLPDPGAYGRIVRRDGKLAAIIEAKEYDATLHGPETGEINAGIYLLNLDRVAPLLDRLGNNNRSGEYYITDLLGLSLSDGLSALAISCGDDPNLLGINNPAELSRSEAFFRAAQIKKYLDSGVIIHDPASVSIGPRVHIEPGVELFGPCELYGQTVIASGVVVESHCRIEDTTLAEDAVIHSFSHLVQAQVGPGCLVGPYARLRPGAIMEAASHVGNFVEMKKSRLGEGAKANHLTYLGDAEIGAYSNIGAGTITCNYDGVHKHKTLIGEHVFIGSNTSLVAPVSIGEHALVGAGSVITKEVPADTLAVARGKQAHFHRKSE